jgi:hypothetical protein
VRKLDCLIISTGRAASTAVYRYLNALGDLGLPDNKEPHFWCTIKKYGGIYPLLERINISTLSEYECIYEKADRMIDASVGYFFTIDEVVSQLKIANQRPKVVFLYREPLSRANSLFNELRKKGIEKEETIEASMLLQRKPGLWWEYYYDNVAYADVFLKLSQNFDSLMAVNYEIFIKHPEKVMSEICQYLDVEVRNSIEYEPVNSSAEAALLKYSRAMPLLRKLLPTVFKQRLVTGLWKLNNIRNTNLSALEPYLKYSLAQYTELRNLTKLEDIHYVARD